MFSRLSSLTLTLLLAGSCGWAQGGAYTTQFRVSPPAPTAPNPFSHSSAKSGSAPFGASTSRGSNASTSLATNRNSGIFIRNRIVSRQGYDPVTRLPVHLYGPHSVRHNVSPRLPYNYDLQSIDPALGQNDGALNSDSSLEVMEPKAVTGNKAGKTSSVTFESTPAGADVYIDGSFIGDSPDTVLLASGLHTISVRQWGYQTWRRTLTVTAGGKTSIEAILQEN